MARELDLQLRRRGIQTIVLGGVATNMGVESRRHDRHGKTDMPSFFAEDATSAMSAQSARLCYRQYLFQGIRQGRQKC